jgi:hypothetical protein
MEIPVPQMTSRELREYKIRLEQELSNLAHDDGKVPGLIIRIDEARDELSRRERIASATKTWAFS